MTAEPLRVLHLEDELDDAELVRAALTSEGIPCEIRLVSSRKDFLEALESGRPDLILSDYALPGFDGLSALAIARERAGETPFILISGTLGEEAAIESLRSGATDYVLKHRLGRLGPAVRRAVSEAAEARKRSQAERMFRDLLESAPDAMVIVGRDGRIVLANAQAERMFGYSKQELLDRSIEILLPEKSRAAHAGLRAQYFGGPATRPMGAGEELMGRRKNGEEFPAEISLSPLLTADGMLVTSAIRDVTQRKQLEAQLLQSQKMEAIGRLAGGVAHDFNNLLNVITGYSEMLLDKSAPADPRRAKLEQILSASARAASLTRQLLAFSRKQVIETRVLDLNAILSDMEKMLRRLIGEDVELVLHPGKGLGHVKADRGQIEQVVMNLVVNARDAMPRGGRLTLETANIEIDASRARRHADARPGAYVMLAVGDTGSGMEPSVKAHIFEPFFTTKPVGHGTGLGLATVYGIVKQGAGFISVDSEPGRGSRFEIGLPAVAEDVARPGVAEAEPAPGTETILLVEDEEIVRGMAREILERYGYKVLEASDGVSARSLCGDYAGDIHLLLTDVVMPRMSGRDLASHVTSARPGIRVVYMSGYADDAILRHGVLEDGVNFLQKPFTPSALARKVREALDREMSPKP